MPDWVENKGSLSRLSIVTAVTSCWTMARNPDGAGAMGSTTAALWVDEGKLGWVFGVIGVVSGGVASGAAVALGPLGGSNRCFNQDFAVLSRTCSSWMCIFSSAKYVRRETPSLFRSLVNVAPNTLKSRSQDRNNPLTYVRSRSADSGKRWYYLIKTLPSSLPPPSSLSWLRCLRRSPWTWNKGNSLT